MKRILTTLTLVLVGHLLSPVSTLFAEDSTADLLTHYHFELGYQGVSEDGDLLFAEPYRDSEAGPVGNLSILRIDPRFRAHLEGSYLGENEHFGQFDLDYRGLLRLKASAEDFSHRLDHIPYDEQNRPPASRLAVDGSPPEILTLDLDPGADYRRELDRRDASLRVKLPMFPAHIAVGYWRWAKQGDEQHRFLVEGSGSEPQSCTGCHMTSKTRTIDRLTEQVNLSMDAHLGYVDVRVEHAIRDFKEQADPSVSTFGSQYYATDPPIEYRAPGDYPHDVVPDARLQFTNLEAHTSLSGGLVGIAGITFGKRSNEGKIADELASRPETDFQKYSGDLVYTPASGLTLRAYYRLLDMDTSNPGFQEVEGHGVSREISDPVDLERDVAGLRLAWRPQRNLLLRGEVSQVTNHRDDIFQEGSRRWNVPHREEILTTRWTFRSDIGEERRLRWEARYRYRQVDDPAYASTAETEHRAFTGLTWNGREHGAAIHLNYRHGVNKDFNLLIEPNADGEYLQLPYGFQRNAWDTSLNGWWNPLERVRFQAGGGYSWIDIDQQLVYGSDPDPTVNIVSNDTEYRQRQLLVHADLVVDLAADISSRVGYRYERASGDYSTGFSERELAYLGFPTPLVGVDADGLLEASRFEYAGDSFHLGIDWKPDPTFYLTAGYDLSRYRDHLGSRTDGEIEVFMLSLGMAW